ncbi:hypothetical protein BW686_15475 [Pseudomonas syringae]|uniref:Uncharacterized protein n=2 Tax=Pseudomonas syringae TaxID=317 RepID=A0A244EPX4_PSESX|nr:hypothetical protein [Pseudomonas syringae]MCI3944829.1 hypothetical protein [Pseudomonas syringae]OUM06498.1 hypothetical protein BW686_15475 [Pseudomonas syringae]
MRSPASKRFLPPMSGEGMFDARVNKRPFVMTSLTARLALRPELERAPDQWIWKVIAEGKADRKPTRMGLFLNRDLEPGTHNLIDNEHISVIYNERCHGQSVIYHSAHFQEGMLTLLEANPYSLKLRGAFSFRMSAINLEVTDGVFDVYCR